jgi:hypothetical protein
MRSSSITQIVAGLFSLVSPRGAAVTTTVLRSPEVPSDWAERGEGRIRGRRKTRERMKTRERKRGLRKAAERLSLKENLGDKVFDIKMSFLDFGKIRDIGKIGEIGKRREIESKE